MTECVFCNIINGKIPAEKVFENKSFIAILDIFPANKGHTLVVPKKHVEKMMDMDDKEIGEMTVVAKKIAKALKEALSAGGINFISNNGKLSGQLIDHAHLHVIPRFSGDKIDFGWNPKKYEKNEIKEMGQKLRSTI